MGWGTLAACQAGMGPAGLALPLPGGLTVAISLCPWRPFWFPESSHSCYLGHPHRQGASGHRGGDRLRGRVPPPASQLGAGPRASLTAAAPYPHPGSRCPPGPLPFPRRWRCYPCLLSLFRLWRWLPRWGAARTHTGTRTPSVLGRPERQRPLPPSPARLISSTAEPQPGDMNTCINCRLCWGAGLYLLGKWVWGLSLFQMGYKSGGCYFWPLGAYKSLLQ